MTLLGSLRASISPDIGLDLGTANSVVYERGAGVIVSEPSVVAYRGHNDEVIAIGRPAKEMDGRVNGRVRVVRPLRRGTISDFRAARALVATLVDRVLAARPRLIPRLVTSVPGCATDIECKAVEHAVREAGARSVMFLPQAVASAVGAGLDVASSRAQMIVDIGGGTTEIAVLSLYGIVRLRSVQVGGEQFDRAIIHRLAAERFSIGPLTAEELKIALGYAGPPPGRPPARVSGIDATAAAPRIREVPEATVGEAMREGVEFIIRAVCAVLESTPPEVTADLCDTGITLTGGGALIPGLARELSTRTNVPTSVAADPLLCAARGAGEVLASPTLSERLRPSADRLTRWYQSLRIGMRESYSP
ncbi:MAG: rod shape-determining protein [Candidatus Eremiobacteraeota bacterium]|nr:rod shape-determining protein [Candidatus Eremiobacteraeota bacterium]MBV9648147.1 rod shape-determining protein [Candidatus Eremiobacteraeota bacterium]